MSSEETYARRKGLNIRDALVFVLDWRIPMLRADEAINVAEDICSTSGTSSLLSVTLRCVADILKSKIIARSSDIVSVIVFGARGTHSRRSWPGVRVLFPLRQPDAASIKLLQRLAQRLEAGDANHLLEMDSESLKEELVDPNDADFCFGPDERVEFDKVLWAVRHQFTAVSASRLNVLHRKRVFLFTNDEDPSRGSRAIRELSLTQARDLADMSATLDISLLTSPSQLTDTAQADATPDSATFFNDLVYTDEVETTEEKGSVMIATVYSFDDLLTRVRKQHMTKRANRKTVLILGDDYKIGVAMYTLVKKATRPTKVELVAATNKPVFKITTTTCEQAGEVLRPNDVRHIFLPSFLTNTTYKTPGRNKAANEASPANELEAPAKAIYGFKKSELVKAKALGRVGIVMYGFRKLSVLRKEYTLNSPTFLFPDDTEYVGSTRAFASLLKCMLKREVVGIASVRLSERYGHGMRFAALVPQQEAWSTELEQTAPGGLQMYYLPYKDDIYTAWRKEMKEEVKEEEQEVIVKKEDMESSELQDEPHSVSVARKMVRNMKITKYSPHLFLNPDLQRFYAGLENAAGVESRFNPQDDLLNPDIESLQHRGGHLATELKRLEVGEDFDGEALADRFSTLSKKRAAEQSEAAIRRDAEKKAAIAEAVKNCDDDMFIENYHLGTLNKLLKAELQVYCRAHGLNEKGTKKNLLILVEDDIRDKLEKTQS